MSRTKCFNISVVALLVIGVAAVPANAATQGGNSFGSGPTVSASVKAEAPIQSGNYFCGENKPELAVRGVVKYKRKGNTVSTTVKVTAGEPNTEYKVQLAEDAPLFCDLLAGEFSLKTNAKGKGHAKGSFEVPEEGTIFFADVDTAGWVGEYPGQGDTPAVSLP
jgi:hypothetical protein